MKATLCSWYFLAKTLVKISILQMQDQQCAFHWCHGQRRAGVWWCSGRLLDYMAPYQILVLSSGIGWLITVSGYTLFVTSQYHLMFNVCKPTFWRSLLTQHADYSTWTLLNRCCTMCHCNEHKLYQGSKLGDQSNTALNPKKEQFVTTKISDNALKQESRATEPVVSLLVFFY